MGILGEFLASFAWAYLRWYLERQAIRDDERRAIALEGLEKINRALSWKADHPVRVDPNDPFADFVHESDKPAKSPDKNP